MKADPVADAIAIFDKSADRTTPNAQTEAWKVLRAEIERLRAIAEAVERAPVVQIGGADGMSAFLLKCGKESLPSMYGKRVRLLAIGEDG